MMRDRDRDKDRDKDRKEAEGKVMRWERASEAQ